MQDTIISLKNSQHLRFFLLFMPLEYPLIIEIHLKLFQKQYKSTAMPHTTAMLSQRQCMDTTTLKLWNQISLQSPWLGRRIKQV